MPGDIGMQPRANSISGETPSCRDGVPLPTAPATPGEALVSGRLEALPQRPSFRCRGRPRTAVRLSGSGSGAGCGRGRRRGQPGHGPSPRTNHRHRHHPRPAQGGRGRLQATGPEIIGLAAGDRPSSARVSASSAITPTTPTAQPQHPRARSRQRRDYCSAAAACCDPPALGQEAGRRTTSYEYDGKLSALAHCLSKWLYETQMSSNADDSSLQYDRPGDPLLLGSPARARLQHRDCSLGGNDAHQGDEYARGKVPRRWRRQHRHHRHRSRCAANASDPRGDPMQPTSLHHQQVRVAEGNGLARPAQARLRRLRHRVAV